MNKEDRSSVMDRWKELIDLGLSLGDISVFLFTGLCNDGHSGSCCYYSLFTSIQTVCCTMRAVDSIMTCISTGGR